MCHPESSSRENLSAFSWILIGIVIAIHGKIRPMKGDAMTSFDTKKAAAAGLVLVVAVGLMACSSAQPTDDPDVDRMGKFILMNKGSEAETLIGYRYAQQNPGAPWLLLEAAVTSPPNQTATIKRENVSVTTPEGKTIQLATQKDVNEAWGVVMPIVNAADVVRDPMNYWQPRRLTLLMRFFVAPGSGISYDEFSVNNFRVCEGRFLFEIPGGVQAGRYVLTIGLEESEIIIPIPLEN